MKKFLVIIVALILVLAFFGCSKDDTAPSEQDTETVETTETAGEEAEASEEAGASGRAESGK